MDARQYHPAAAAADDPMQIDNVLVSSNSPDQFSLASVINAAPGIMTDFMFDDIRPRLSTQETARLATSCRFFHSIFQPQLDELALQRLNQAIIDDDHKRVRDILNAKPFLLLHAISSPYVVESKLTWQRFKLGAGDTPLAIAAKRKQIEMIKLLLPYYDQLVQDNRFNEESRQYVSAAREAGLKAWSFYAMTKNAENQDEIVIPTEYSSVINNLIDVFSIETLAAGRTDFTQLSENTESAMRSLLDLLVPKSAIELDNHIDVELLLLAAYQLYDQRFNAFTSWEQRDAFCIRVIGLIQSALSPETAKIFCQGLYNVVNHNQQVGAPAAALKLFGGESFYRASRESLSGLSGKYFCLGNGNPRPDRRFVQGAGAAGGWSGGWPRGAVGGAVWVLYKTYVEQKHQTCRAYAATSARAEARAIDRLCNLLK